MKHTFVCPTCKSLRTREATGTSYWLCLECGRLDFAEKFVFNPREVPVKYHQTIDIKVLNTKQIYGGSQYDNRD